MNKSVFVRAHRWFDKINCNTYFAARMVDAETNDSLAYISFAYGYGTHFEDEILDRAISEQGWPPRIRHETSGGKEAALCYYERVGIKHDSVVTDGLKRDMKRV